MYQAKTICFITQTYCFGGTEVHTLSLIKLLLRKNYKVVLICCRHHIYDDYIASMGMDDIQLIHTDLSVNDTGSIFKERWKSFLNNITKDILIFPKPTNYSGSNNFLKLCRKLFKKNYHIEHSEADSMPQKTSKRYFRGAVRGLGLWWYKEKYLRKSRSFYADRIVAVSHAVGRRLIHDCYYPSHKVIVIPNGVNGKDFERKDEIGREFRKKYEIPEDTFVFGMLTRLDFVKGVDIALQAFNLMLKNGVKKNVNLIIAGEGEEASKLKKIVFDNKIEKYVIFTGFIKRPQEALSAFDSILLPSRKEALGLALLEGMAAGCLPIVSNIGGMPEIVNNPNLGWLVPPESVTDLYHVMCKVVGLDELAFDSMKKNAVKRVLENFDAEISQKKLLETFGLT